MIIIKVFKLVIRQLKLVVRLLILVIRLLKLVIQLLKLVSLTLVRQVVIKHSMVIKQLVNRVVVMDIIIMIHRVVS